MKFRCNQQDLSRALNIVSKAVTSRTTIPILKGILIEADETGNLKMVASDLDITIEEVIKVETLEKGSVVVQAKLFGDIIRKLPGKELEVEVVLAEREYLKTLCQTVPSIPSKSLEPLISYLYHYSTFTDCFINLMAKNQRRLYSILLREIESELKSGNSERVLANADLYASMSETEFSELMKAAFPDDSCYG